MSSPQYGEIEKHEYNLEHATWKAVKYVLMKLAYSGLCARTGYNSYDDKFGEEDGKALVPFCSRLLNTGPQVYSGAQTLAQDIFIAGLGIERQYWSGKRAWSK